MSKEGKRCGRCHATKPLKEFAPHSRDGWQSYCMECASEWSKEYYKANRAERLAYQNHYNQQRRKK